MDISDALEKHKLWLDNKAGGEQADLRRADLSGAKGLIKLIGVEVGNFYWKRCEEDLSCNSYQFRVGINKLRKHETFASDERVLFSYPGFHFASRSWCSVNYPERTLEVKIRVPDGAQINEPWATDGKASADMIEIVEVWRNGENVTEEFRNKKRVQRHGVIAMCDKDCFNCRHDDCIIAENADTSATHRRWREKNKDRVKAQNMAWRRANPDRIKEYNQNSRAKITEEQKEKARESSRRYYQNNKEKVHARRREYRANNREKINAYERAYYARKKPDKKEDKKATEKAEPAADTKEKQDKAEDKTNDTGEDW